MRTGPSYGGGGGADAFRARLEESAAFLLPVALIVGLAIAGGGYETSPRHIAGLAIWLVVVGLLALGAASRSSAAKPFYWAAGLILALAFLSALSSFWSGSVELSVIEADRVLVYLGVLVAAFLIAQTAGSRERFGEGLGIALFAIAVLALGSRLLPHVLSVSDGLGAGSRTLYPLGYWNGDGVACALGAVLAIWMSRRARVGALRWLAVAMLPILFLTLYFTYSRGGLFALGVAALAFLVLSHDRLWLLATLAIGAVTTLPAILAVQSRDALANNVDLPEVTGQGVTVLLILVAGIAAALLLFWGLRRLERAEGRRTGRVLAVSRDRRVLTGLAIAAAVIAIGAAIAVGGRAWSQFTDSEQLVGGGNPEARFESLSGSGRSEFFRVALDAFGEKPVLGNGAGTYQFSWDQLRHIRVPVHDTHSLYLQALSELGVVGAVLVLAIVFTLLWIGYAAWRDARGRQKELFAVLFAICLSFAVSMAIDWFWQIAALGFVFFLSSGALIAGRCGQLQERRAAGGEGGPQRRFGFTVVGLAIAWIAALALIGPLLVDRELDASKAAAAEGNVPSAIDRADTARSIEPWAATPYVQLGLLAQQQREFPLAIERLGQAIDREDRNWILYYLKAKAEHEAGDASAASADHREAVRLNPLEGCLREGWEGCG